MKRLRHVLTVPFVAALALTMTNPTTANAALPQEDLAETIAIEVPMFVTEIDVKQAAKAGNKVVTEGNDRVLYDGKTGAEIARVPKKASSGASSGDVSTAGIVYGTCGSSWVYLRDAPGRQFYFYTGFDLTKNAIDFDWYVSVRGENGSAVDNYSWSDSGPMWPDDYWSSGNQYSTQDISSGSYYYARASGRAYIPNGEVCTSGYPTDGRYLYY